MTPHDATTRERVARAIRKADGMTTPWQDLSAVEQKNWLDLADAAIAALQPPTETRWEVSDWTVESFALTGGTDRERLRKALPNLLRDFADGVSDEVLERAWDHMATAPGNEPRNFLRALADQEEGKPHA